MFSRNRRQIRNPFCPSYFLFFSLFFLLFFVKTAITADKQEKKDSEQVREIAGEQAELSVPLGEAKILEFPFELGSIYVGNPNLFDYRRISDGEKTRKLRIIPKKAGFTDLTIHDADYRPRITYSVRVTREDMNQVMGQLQDLLGDIEGLKIRSLAGTVILDGEILLPRDFIRIFRVLEAIQGERDPQGKAVTIRNLATISKLTLNILAEKIEKEINEPEIQVRVVNNNLFLEGVAPDETTAERALELAKVYLPELFIERTRGEGGEVKPKQTGGVGGGLPSIIDFLRVRPKPSAQPAQDIKITMNFVQLDNEYDKTFDFSWKPLVTDNSSVKFDSNLGELTAGLVATVSSLFPKLNEARSHGHAKILKQQQVIVKDRSDTPAVIDSSLQIYTRVPDDKGNAVFQAVEVKNVTKVRAASIAGTDSIELGIQVELSEPVAAPEGSPPQIARNSLQTQVIIKNGDSAVLGGSGIDTALSGYNRAPPRQGGGNNQTGGSPIFNFQRSKSFNRKKNQYVIFVTPEIIKTASQATEDITRKFKLNSGER